MNKQVLKTFHAPAERLDMDEIKKQAEKFNSSDSYLKTLDYINVFIIILNSYRQIVYANIPYLKLLKIEDISSILGKRPGETVSCINAYKNEGGCGTSVACQKCGAGNIILKSININDEVEGEVSIVRSIDSVESTINLFEKVAPLELNNETFYLASFSDATDAVVRRSMEKIFFHDVINTAGALKGILNLLRKEVPQAYENEVAQVEGLFEGLIDEIQSQKQLLAAESDELFVEVDEINSKELLDRLKKLYEGYSNSVNKRILVDECSVNIDFKSDITLLKRVIGNMIKNALEATQENGSISVGVRKYKEDHLKYWVKNSSLISEEVQENIFKRSFSTKGAERGLGAYSMKLLGEKYLKGHVGFTTHKDLGTCFYIEIPLV